MARGLRVTRLDFLGGRSFALAVAVPKLGRG